jgi:zinc protease
MIITVAGGVDAEQVIERIGRYFGDWTNPQQPTPPELPLTKPLTETQRGQVSLPGKAQVDIVMGAVGPQRADADYFPASIGNNILGQFGMMGRIGEAVREKAGLAYYASSSLGAGLGPGPWEISAGVDPQNTEQAIQLMVDEVQRFTHELVSAEELEDVQTNYIGRLPLSLEANSGNAGAMMTMERYGLGLDYYLRYPALVRGVKREDVLRAAQRFLDADRLAIAVAGAV